MGAAVTFENEIYPGSTVTFALFRGVANAGEVRRSLMKGEFEATLLKPSMIVDVFQVLVAFNKAAHSKNSGKMITKNVHSEILYCLSPSKNISDSFRKFGVGDTDDTMFIAIVDDKKSQVLEYISQKIQGIMVPLSDLKELTDENCVKKIYKVSEEELKISLLLDSVNSRIAVKDVMAV